MRYTVTSDRYAPAQRGDTVELDDARSLVKAGHLTPAKTKKTKKKGT